MRLYTSEQEARVLQAAVALYCSIVTSGRNIVYAQGLLSRIAQCLELQGKEKVAAPKDSD